MSNLGLLSILSRSIRCETGYIRRYIYVIKSIAYFLVGKHFFVSPRIFIKRLIHATKNDNSRIPHMAREFKKAGYINVKNIIDKDSSKKLRLNCEKLQKHYIESFGNKDKICKNDYWKRLNNSWEESSHIKELLKSSPELSLLLLKYIGPTFCLSQYDYIYVPGDWDGSTTGSRGWHLDNHHMKVVKLFIPVHKITKEHGATCLLNPKYSRIYAKFHPFNMPDTEVSKIDVGSYNPIKVIEMNANDAFLIDTSRCLHMGGRSAKSRLFIVFTFTGIASYCTKWPRNLIEPKVQHTLFDVNSSLTV